jgi:hypothetical protein
MEMQKRVARDKLEYAGKVLKAGETFDCEAQDVEVLLAFEKIEPRKGEQGYKTRQMTARTE